MYSCEKQAMFFMIQEMIFFYFQWFDEKHQQVESLDSQLRRLHTSMEALVHHRKGLYTFR